MKAMSLSLRDRGATDPLLIIAGIAISLTLLIGGSFAVVAFMHNTQDRTARDDLARVATAQAAYHSENDEYAELAIGPDIATNKKNTELEDGKVGYTPSENNIVVSANKGGWTAVTQSRSGKVFARTSFDTKTYEVEGRSLPDPDALGPKTLSRTNLAAYPDGYYTKPANLGEFGLDDALSATWGTYRNIVNATDGPDGTDITSYLRWSGAANAVKTSQYGFGIAGNPVSTNVPAGVATPPVGKVTITVYMRSSTNTQAYIRTRLATPTGWAGAATNSPWVTLKAGQWTALSTIVTTTAAAPRLSAAILTGGYSGPGDTLDATGLIVEKGTDQMMYFDGNSFDFPMVLQSWKGEPHRSQSEQYTRAVLTNATRWAPMRKPAGMQFPTGISWEDVAEDLILVKR